MIYLIGEGCNLVCPGSGGTPAVMAVIFQAMTGHAMDMSSLSHAPSVAEDSTSGEWNYYLVAFSYVVAVLASYVTLDVGGHSLACSGLRRVALLTSASVLMGFGIWTMHFTGMLASVTHQGVRYDADLTLISLVFSIIAAALAFSVVGFFGSRPSHIAGAALIMGIGIIVMHYTGMAAMRMPDVSYRLDLFALSFVIAVGASAAAMYLTFNLVEFTGSRGWKICVRVVAALVMGLAVAGMHYTGMAAVVTEPAGMIPGDVSSAGGFIGSTDLGLVVGTSVSVLFAGAILVSATGRRLSDQRTALERYEEKAQSILDQMNEGYFELDLDGNLIAANDSILLRGSWIRETIIGRNFLGLAPPDERERLESIFCRLLESGEPVRHLECRMLTATGAVGHFEVSATLFYGRQGLPIGVRGILRNVTERHKSEAALRESEERFKNLFDQSVDTLILHDRFGNIVDCNREACRSLGYEKDELLGMNVRDIATRLLPSETLSGEGNRNSREEPSLWQQAISGRPGRIIGYHLGEHVRKDGFRFPVEVGVGAFRFGDKRLIFASVRDITERRTLERKLEHQATHDTLTGLPNRRLFNERLDDALSRNPQGSYVGVLFLDLDNFKAVNDSLGHGVGDRLLVAASERLQSSVSSEAMVSRFGGDEFTIYIPGVADQATIVRIATQVTDTFRQHFDLDEREVFVSTSIGAALGDGENDCEEVLRRADLALYRAKASGRSRFELFDDRMNQETVSRLDLELDLRRALREDELFVCYQPIFDLRTGSVDGFEALVRWRHPIRGVIGPCEFVWLAEETGLIYQVGQFVFETACEQLALWQRERKGFSNLNLSVNISVKQLQDPSLARDMEEIVHRSGIEPDRLTLEITESVFLQENSQSVDTLLQLRERGMNIALDDFGTGYSSLSQLRNFPINVLKVDRSFVSAIERGPEDQAIVEAIIRLAGALGLSVVAEGIETASQLNYLATRNCDFGQGFHLSEPLYPEAVEELLGSAFWRS